MSMSSDPATAVPAASYSPDAASPPPAPEATSAWEDFIDIFHTPAAVFRRRERGSWLLPALVVAVLVGVFFIVSQGVLEPVLDAEFERGAGAAMRANPQLTPEMMQQARSMNAMVTKVMVFVAIPIVIWLVGTALWLVGKLLDAVQSYRTALVVAAWAYVPKVLDSMATAIQSFVFTPAELDGRYRLSLGVGRFLDPDTTSPILIALAGRLDVFTIWVTVLLGIGLMVTGKVDRGRAIAAGVAVWLLGAVPGILQALQG